VALGKNSLHLGFLDLALEPGALFFRRLNELAVGVATANLF
jgi:hypothetical protein